MNCRVADVKPRLIKKLFWKTKTATDLPPFVAMDILIKILESKLYTCERKDVFVVNCFYVEKEDDTGKIFVVQWDAELRRTNRRHHFGINFKWISGNKKSFERLTDEITKDFLKMYRSISSK